LFQRAFQHGQIGQQKIAIKRDRRARDNQEIAQAIVLELMAEIQQALPEAGLGLRLKPVRPQNLAQCLSIKAAIRLKAEQSNQQHASAIAEQQRGTARRLKPEFAKHSPQNRNSGCG
jgi:hypothetical protein